jgi:23S rRNA G2445 N2-methylase RlmL
MPRLKKKTSAIEVLFEDLDREDVSSVMKHLADINEILRQLNKEKLAMEKDLKAFLKQKKWDRYLDPNTKISVTLDVHKEEIINRKYLEDFLSPAQMAQIVSIKTQEKITVVSKKTKERLKRTIKEGN